MANHHDLINRQSALNSTSPAQTPRGLKRPVHKRGAAFNLTLDKVRYVGLAPTVTSGKEEYFSREGQLQVSGTG